MFKLTKFLLPTLILSSFLIGCQKEASKNDVGNKQEVKRNDGVVFNFKSIKEDNGNLDVKYPVFEGEAFKDINDFIDKEVKKIINDYHDAKKYAKEDNIEPLYHLNITTYIIDKDIINLKEFLFFYEGGAHGMPGEIWTVFIKDENQKKYVQIKLSDIINLNGKCEKDLRQAIYEELKRQNASSAEDVLKQDLTLDNFYLDQDAIVFVFNPYEVGSFAEGIYKAEIPYNSLPCVKNNSITKKFLDQQNF
jgi:hypothetical protein